MRYLHNRRIRRERLDLIVQLIKIVENGIGPTHLMYELNTSYGTLKSMLSHLKSIGLIKFIDNDDDDKRKVYNIISTKKGDSFVELYDSVSNRLVMG